MEEKKEKAVAPSKEEVVGAGPSQPSNEPKNKPGVARIEVKIGIVAAAVIVALGVLFGTHVLCLHSWSDATCTHPATCELCGATEGKALGHDWKAATCTQPKTCRRCGKTKGSSLGHDWEAATCTKPKTCKRCVRTEGESLGHTVDTWKTVKEATCTATGRKEGVCTRCGATVTETIDMLAHTPGEWKITKDVTITSSGYVVPGTQEQKCTVCGAVLGTKDYTVNVSTSQVNALSRAASYLDMGGFSYKSLVEQLEFEGFSNEDATFAADHCGADWMYQAEQKAESYMSFMGFSRSGLIDQLEFEGFTPEQATHGADHVGL